MNHAMLSSRWTYFLKYIYGPLWIVALGVLVNYVMSNHVFDSPDNPLPAGAKYIFLAVWVISGIGILRFAFRLKRVELRENRLYVSNFLREWELSPHEIESVQQSKWSNSRPIRVRLRRDIAGLGSSFLFIPPTSRKLRFWHEDPQVETLRRFATSPQ